VTRTATPSHTPHDRRPADDDAPGWHRRLCPVGDRLVVSGDLPAGDHRRIAHLGGWVAAGITGIVDCRGEWSDASFVERIAPEVGYVHVGIDDAGDRRPDHWFDDGVAGALDLLDRTDGDVLVHCHMGINRGPSMAFAVLLNLGRDPLEALDAIRSARPIAALIYAEDAVGWWARRRGLPSSRVRALRKDVRRWHRDNGIDPSRAIRQIRHSS
jgi:dual specificity phosphatase 3